MGKITSIAFEPLAKSYMFSTIAFKFGINKMYIGFFSLFFYQCLHLYRNKETFTFYETFLIHPFINEPLVHKTSRGKDMHVF